jgi:hypothetical protein
LYHFQQGCLEILGASKRQILHMVGHSKVAMDGEPSWKTWLEQLWHLPPLQANSKAGDTHIFSNVASPKCFGG